MKNKLLWALLLIVSPILHFAQTTFPVNGVNNPQITRYTFINANIYVSADNFIANGTLEIEDGKIKATKKQGDKYDTTAIVIDLKGKYIYPSFIDVYSNYGMPAVSEKKRDREGGAPQYETNTKGAFGWNEAIKPETNAAQLFKQNANAAEELRKLGFGAVVAFVPDGVSRGTSALVSLADDKENKTVLNKETGANFSFKKGSSAQSYPNSLMGSIALIRQTFYDAQAYQKGLFTETNLSLDALNTQLKLPLFFEANSRWDIARIQKIGKEFGYNFIIKTNGDEYQILDVLKKDPANLVVPLNFPAPADVKSFFDEAGLRYTDLKHRHLAPWNAYLLQQNNIPFAFTLSGLKDKKDFLKNIAEAIECGLDEKTALNALTIIPAKYIKADDKLGTLDKGKIANLIITDKELFEKDCHILENWVQGKRYQTDSPNPYELTGHYKLTIDGNEIAILGIGLKKGKPEIKAKDSTIKINKVVYNKDIQEISFYIKLKETTYHLSGWQQNGINYSGEGSDLNGKQVKWESILDNTIDTTAAEKPLKIKPIPSYMVGVPYQYADKTSNTFLIRNVTVWTNEKEGILPNTNVLVKNGKVVAVGDVDLKKFGINDSKDIQIINGTGKHLTAGIIDEHSHIGIMGGVNEGSQSVTAEVRIGDVLNPDDINIYRQLAGGVTTSQLLHGSANAIGGQSAVIKLKWGEMADSLLFAGAIGRIKFALGENVKQSNWGERVTERFPQTRMGVEQVFEDVFTRAEEYERAWADFKSGKTKKEPRKEIELEALLEVLRGKCLVTCHSYSQQEINMLMKVAEKHGFNINIFTHVLEGYKIADKIKEHGAGASTFSDWWGYKYEVIEATPYNASLLNEVGVITCINSDDAEMGRRLNQEAAKAIKYGGMSEEDALKMVTLNPAKLMKIDNRVGSVKAGKDADLVLWSGHPLSIYSKPIKTFIEGVAYFDADAHKKAEEQLRKEKHVLIEEMNKAVADGKSAEKAKTEEEHLYHCDDIEVYGEEDGK